MKNENKQILMMQFKNSIPQDKLLIFKKALDEAPEEVFDELSSVPLVDTTTVLLLSVFLGGFGVDRFYLGDTNLGVMKLLLGWLTFGIWPLVDIYFSFQRSKQINFERLMSVIG